MNATQPTAPKTIKQGKATEIVRLANGRFSVRALDGYCLDLCDTIEEARSAFESNEEQEDEG